MLGGVVGAVGPVGAAAGAVGAGIGVGAGGFYGGWASASQAYPDPVVNQGQNPGGYSPLEGALYGFGFGSALGPVPGLLGAVIGAMGSQAQGDPSGGGPSGGGPAAPAPAPVSQTMKAIEQVIASPPVAQPAAKPMLDDRKRKRIGRQETILTKRSALSEAPTSRPTLLGQ